MEKVNREDVAAVLAEKVMEWCKDEYTYFDRKGDVIIDPRLDDAIDITDWNPLDDEGHCALVRDKLAETMELCTMNFPVWTPDGSMRIWQCAINKPTSDPHIDSDDGRDYIVPAKQTPDGYRESVCRAALATIGMEMEE